MEGCGLVDKLALPANIEEHAYDIQKEIAPATGGGITETPELMWGCATPAGWPGGIMRARFSASEADERIAQVVAEMQCGRIPNFWRTGPASTPDDLEQRLERHGFARAFEAIGMVLEYSDLRADLPWPEGLRICRVEDEETFGHWARAFTLWLFGKGEETIPLVASGLRGVWSAGRLTCFAGFLGDSVIASSSLYASRGMAGVYHVAVSPEHRRRGIGAQMTIAPVLEGQRKGLSCAVLHASALGAGVYRGIGFRDVCRLGRYVYRPKVD